MADKKKSDKDSKKYNTAAYTEASPTLLAAQPAEETKDTKPSYDEVKQWKILEGHLENRLTGLRTWRQSWWSQLWADLSAYLQPRRSTWLTQTTGGWPSPNNMGRGKQLNNAIVDPTGTYAVRVCSSGLMSGLASPSRPWFKIVPAVKTAQIDAAGRAWIDEVEDRIYTVLAGSNFYNSFAQECEDLVVFGTAPIVIYEDEKDIIRCYNPCIGEYFLASDATMRVDTFNRAFVFTVAQIVDFFQLENCPETIKTLWHAKGANLNTEFIVAHSIEPNFGIGNTNAGKIPGKFSWREVYWLFGQGAEKPLSIRGFLDQPFAAPRWSTLSNDAYGRGPGEQVLPDVIQLNVETMRKAEAIEKMVRPPLLADMQLKNQPSSSLPGSVTYVNGLSAGTGMRSIYQVNPDIAAMERDLAAIQARVKLGFYNDVILMLSSNPVTNRTAYETSQLIMERLQVLGPVIENIIGESLKPKLRRIYSIMDRKGMFPPMPDSMKAAGGPVVDFVSMLALAQKATATGGLERLAAFVGNLVAVYPEAKDLMNIDAIIEKMSELLDNPQAILHSPEQLAQIRAARSKAQQQAQQAADMEHGVNTVATGAQAAQVLSDTNVGAGQSALQALIGSGEGGKSQR